ncbi:hypothetical protein FJV41_23870 [Myxococcus llanfairpwllgwyngyllgogerychwyrndrobwllllantysiliogogogochensis]|uniref:Conjugal transfer protein TrbJ n=1 Tax=Myxococcus llanfairpwllgwyngyllgogerychwyrndrobwllllantysiliogogogochensis TaxID=2590453 RepID=A0A540WWP1_9BACT|nr:hypothetical protein [Myxococcus llanfairpwllgwyngyllgogerychwyrndrobwllllantysiliogogogochensis]TQF13431.1 hypothetical protein FJV41_23870 [Myxococcus llanfairpwllgwyngyllgogerychwyrndrobwllllantysiliogogogochensis]
MNFAPSSLPCRIAAVALILCLVRPGPARADLFGGDVAVLSGLLVETLMQGYTMTQQLLTTKAQLESTLNSAKMLSQGDFGRVQQLLLQTNQSIESIQQTVGSVDRQFEALTANRDLTQVRFSEFAAQYGGWLQQINSTVTAARQLQMKVTQVQQANSESAQAILSRSSTADGEVRQLQSILQMLAVMQNQLGALIQHLDASERVTNTMAANAAAEKQRAEETRRRRLEGYQERGPKPEVRKGLPEVRMR